MPRALPSTRRTVLAAIAIVMVCATSNASAATDPFTGVWVLNAAKSSGATARQVLTIQVDGESETYQSDLTNAQGVRQVTNYTARYDGQEYPSRTVVTGGPEGEVVRPGGVILRKTDLYARERHWKQDGRLIRVLHRKVSADGKTMRSQIVDYAADGTETRGMELVFDRQ